MLDVHLILYYGSILLFAYILMKLQRLFKARRRLMFDALVLKEYLRKFESISYKNKYDSCRSEDGRYAIPDTMAWAAGCNHIFRPHYGNCRIEIIKIYDLDNLAIYWQNIYKTLMHRKRYNMLSVEKWYICTLHKISNIMFVCVEPSLTCVVFCSYHNGDISFLSCSCEYRVLTRISSRTWLYNQYIDYEAYCWE
ncbi:MAG: hypothetical protein EXX96DRAFT_605808 [Benjaminiella poitrasii]|nr:MAG: hypothetical protein EXX96DRAFT_605808 [Benjaminiella poitrasii]